MRALDGTSICQPGADRTTWRLHVGYDLATGQVDQLELTDVHGAENLQRLTYASGDIALADRYYARPRDLRPVIDAGADFIVRTGWNSLRLLQPDGKASESLTRLPCLGESRGQDEGAYPRTPTSRLLRLEIRRKDSEQGETERDRLRKEKKCKQRTHGSLEAADYILLLTSLPADVFPAADILTLYRFRWQIELAFKEVCSLAGLDQLPAKKPELARAWIYARLIVAIIAEQIAGQVPESSPSEPRSTRKPIALAPREDRPRNRPRRHQRTAPLAKRPQPLPPNPPAPLRTSATAP